MSVDANEPKKKRKFSPWRVVLGVLLIIFGLSVMAVFIGSPSDSDDTANTTFYVKVNVANIRQCAAMTCKVIDSFPLGSDMQLPYASLADAPEWVEVTYLGDDDRTITGFISKTTLTDKPLGQ